MPTPSRNWREMPQRYRLEAAKCSGCGYISFPPRLICPRCRSRKFERINLSDRGKIMTHTIIRVPPHQFVDQAPFAVAIVELDDGVKLAGQVVDSNFEDLAVGKRVAIEFRKVQEDGEAGILCYGYKFVPE